MRSGDRVEAGMGVSKWNSDAVLTGSYYGLVLYPNCPIVIDQSRPLDTHTWIICVCYTADGGI